MTNEKFTEQVTTLAKFLQTYCADKHALESKREINLELAYKGENLSRSVQTQLCAECEQLFFLRSRAAFGLFARYQTELPQMPASVLRKAQMDADGKDNEI